MYNLQEIALAYAKGASRIIGEDDSYLNSNQEVIPVFISLLFQSLEITLKHLGIESKLFTKKESRDRKLTNNGHGIKEIAELANARLGADKNYPVVMALTAGIENSQTSEIINAMIFSSKFEPTRSSYQSRSLAYSQFQAGELQILDNLKPWVIAVEEVAENLPAAIKIVSEWQASKVNSTTFAIWYK